MLFRCPVIVCYSSHDLNCEQNFCYLSQQSPNLSVKHIITHIVYYLYAFHDLNTILLVHYLIHGLNKEPFNRRTGLDHLNTKLVCYSDPHSIIYFLKNRELWKSVFHKCPQLSMLRWFSHLSPCLNVLLYPFDNIQWGLEYQTFKFRIHSKSLPFKDR